MTVYFVCRSAYEVPLGRRINSFRDPDLLSWFQRVWPDEDSFPDDEDEWCEHQCKLAEKHGIDAYGTWHLFQSMMDRGSAPKTNRELMNWLDELDYPESIIQASEHAWQALTDDDELDIGVMMFDDQFARKYPERVAFLLHNKLKLPTRTSDHSRRFIWKGPVNEMTPVGNERGSVFAILLVVDDGGWLRDLLRPFRFRGVRLPEFPEYLRNANESGTVKSAKWRAGLAALAQLASEHPKKSFPQLLEIHEQVEQEEFDAIPADTSEGAWQTTRFPSMIQKSKHFSQIAFRSRSVMTSSYGDLVYEMNLQWYFFDDLWAANHSDLAKSLLRYASYGVPLL